jgi:hypothetical protein
MPFVQTSSHGDRAPSSNSRYPENRNHGAFLTDEHVRYLREIIRNPSAPILGGLAQKETRTVHARLRAKCALTDNFSLENYSSGSSREHVCRRQLVFQRENISELELRTSTRTRSVNALRNAENQGAVSDVRSRPYTLRTAAVRRVRLHQLARWCHIT